MASSSATPPPYAVAFRWSTRAPCERLGERADPVDDVDADDRRVVVEVLLEEGDAFEHGRTPVVGTAATWGRRDRPRSIYRLMRLAHSCAPTSSAARSTAAEAAAAMAAGLRRAGFDDVRELPLADGGDGTLDALLAARGGSRRHATRHRAARATRSTPSGRCSPAASRWSRWRAASGLALVDGRNDPLRASTRGTGELIAAALRRGARRVIVGVGGSATTDGGLAAVEALGWSFGGVDGDGRVRRDDAVPRRGARVSGRRRARPTRRSRCSRAGSRGSPSSTSSAPASTSRELAGAGAAGGLAGGLAAIGAELEPGFDVVAGAAGLDDALDGVDLVVTGEGAARRHQLRRQGRRRRARVGGRRRRPAPRGDRGSGDRRGARGDRPCTPARRCSRSPTACGRSGEAFARAATLVEEAALEAGREACGATRRVADGSLTPARITVPDR